MKFITILIIFSLIIIISGCSETIFYGQDPVQDNPELRRTAERIMIEQRVKEVVYRGGAVYIDGIRIK